MKYSSTSAQKRSKRTLVIILVLVLLAGAAFAYWRLSATDDEAPQNTDESFINLDPPTEEEQRSGDEIKDELIADDEDGTPSRPSGQKQPANVTIVDAGQYGSEVEVRAFVTNVLAEGTCSYRFSRGSTIIDRQTAATPDATTTICRNLTLDRSDFPTAGDWQLTVSYESPDHFGSNQTTLTLN
jgi:flagellar basal body-associated protein FliL